MRRIRPLLALALLALAGLAPATASARPVQIQPPSGVEIGRVGVGTGPGGLASILIPIHYPIQFAGRLAEVKVWLSDPGHGVLRSWILHEAVSSGRRGSPERRRSFTFVHRLGLDAALTSRLSDGLEVRVLAPEALNPDGDNKVEMLSTDRLVRPLAPALARTCSSVPRLKLRPRHRVSVPLPVCGGQVLWSIGEAPQHGSARIRHGRLVYTAPRRFRSSDLIRLVGRRARGQGTAAASEGPILSDVQVTVGTAAGAVVRALGDSVTAGFGYYSGGTPMTIGHLLECRPPASGSDDACSSNSLVTTNRQKLAYAPDWGLSNNISWAAQWANEHAITNYENLAISGSEPSDWAAGGEFHATTAQVESEDPDYILMTVGANPLLSEMLFGIDHMGCAIYSQIFGGYRECVEKAFAEVHLRESLTRLYTDLVQHTDATIYLMQYHLAIPSSALAYTATQIAEMGKLLNGEIESVAAAVNPQRLQVVTPPHFDVGIDISPVYPSRFSCSDLGYEVDGPSVQSTPTQDELEVLHPLSFCEGPPIGPPWVIGGDTGIHPSAAGYTQMASQVPPPE